VKGKVTVQGGKAGVLMATVRVKGSGEQTFTDKDGNYALVGIEPSENDRSLEVFAEGFRIAPPHPFKLKEEGDPVTVVPPIKLVREAG